MFWPDSEVAIHDARPADWQRFDQHVSGVQRVNAVLDWMRRPAEIRHVFVTLYFDIVDTAGHPFGPDSVVGKERSEERRVGREWVNECRSRWWRKAYKKKKNKIANNEKNK